jgi:hypothetical protein
MMHYRAPVASEWPGGRIPDFVRDLTTVAIAVISREGCLIDANIGFTSLLPEGMAAADMRDVRDLFVNPRFDQLAMRRADATGVPVYRGILNLGSVGGTVCSVQGALYATTEDLLLVAEQEVAGLELLRVRVLRLNDELTEQQRQLANALNETRRQRQLAEAAVRDRDALYQKLLP